MLVGVGGSGGGVRGDTVIKKNCQLYNACGEVWGSEREYYMIGTTADVLQCYGGGGGVRKRSP